MRGARQGRCGYPQRGRTREGPWRRGRQSFRSGRPTTITTTLRQIHVMFAIARRGVPGWRQLIGARAAIDARQMIGTIARIDLRVMNRVRQAPVGRAARRCLRLHNKADTTACHPLRVLGGFQDHGGPGHPCKSAHRLGTNDMIAYTMTSKARGER